jgi:outer membrane lipoprotein-sorting protein
MKKVSLFFSAALLIFFLVSCGSSNDLSGKYDCIEHFSEDMVGKVSLELNKDGTVVMNPINHKGTYEIEGDKVILELDHFDLTFTREGDKLISSDETTVYQKK